MDLSLEPRFLGCLHRRHRFPNAAPQPLMAIAINGSAARRFLARVPTDIDEATANLDRIIKDSRRASEVFDSILALFRRDDQERRAINVNEIALEVLQSSRGELAEHRVTTRTELASELPLIPGHKGQLQQVISNLVRDGNKTAREAPSKTTARVNR
jgi:signal transduction histidine kinase